jgi:hypothetical protein
VAVAVADSLAPDDTLNQRMTPTERAYALVDDRSMRAGALVHDAQRAVRRSNVSGPATEYASAAQMSEALQVGYRATLKIRACPETTCLPLYH